MAGSSPQEKTEAEPAKADNPDKATPDVVASAESSPAEKKGEDKGDMLAAVKAALKKPEAEKTPDSGEQGSKSELEADAPAKEGDAADDGTDDLTDEDTARLKPKTRARINNLLRDRTERDDKIATLEPKASQFDAIQRFVDEAQLTKDEVNQGFDVMRALKHDPLRAYNVLRPIIDQLEGIVGVRLPDDLQQEVSLGRITQPHAQELARTRAQASLTQQQLQRRDTSDQERRQRDDHQGRVNEVSGKVTEWERSQEKSDPDWKLKQPRVSELIELEIVRKQRTEPGFFPTTEQALKMSKDALDRVNEDFKKLSPARRAMNPGHTDAAATRSTAKPKTALEAARAGLAAAG